MGSGGAMLMVTVVEVEWFLEERREGDEECEECEEYAECEEFGSGDGVGRWFVDMVIEPLWVALGRTCVCSRSNDAKDSPEQSN
jgi:hypothetical protein